MEDFCDDDVGRVTSGRESCLWTCEGEPLVELSAPVMFALRCNSLPPNEGLALDERSSLVCVPPSGDSRALKCSPKFLAVEMYFKIFSFTSFEVRLDRSWSVSCRSVVLGIVLKMPTSSHLCLSFMLVNKFCKLLISVLLLPSLSSFCSISSSRSNTLRDSSTFFDPSLLTRLNPQFSALIRWLIFRLCFPPLQPEILRTFFDCSEHLELSHAFVSLGRVRPGDSERIVGARKDCCSVRCSFPVARGLRWTVLRSWLAPGLVPHEVLSSRLSSFSSRCSASPPFFQRSVSLRRALQTFP